MTDINGYALAPCPSCKATGVFGGIICIFCSGTGQMWFWRGQTTKNPKQGSGR